MTIPRAIGDVCGAIIDRIVRWLALSKIHPNVLTFIGLVINIWAAWLFARAGSAADPRVDFRWAGLVTVGADRFGDGQLHTRARRKRHPQVQGGLPGASGAGGADHYRGALRPHGGGALGN